MSVQRHTLPASVRALAKDRACFPAAPKPQARRFAPIERTVKRPGDLVFGNCVRKPELVA